MVYTTQSKITNFEEVKNFFNYLVYERQCNFHPDDDFADYVSKSDGSPVFTSDEVILFNRLMDECFEVCEKLGEDIYDVCLEFFYKKSCVEINLKELLK